MPRRIAISQLDATTLDIINVIRANASSEYQSLVPEVQTTQDLPKVGDILYGYPALANQFVASLVNRIALVRIKSATFNNDYAELKKGYLEFGETVEEVFVEICKAREFSAEKAPAREFKRSLPDVRTAFHAMNWRVQYPITVQNEDLRRAFQSAEGVQDLIAKIIDQVYTADEYDTYLLFKYLIIKAVSHGHMYPVGVNMSDIKNAAKAFRGMSNQLLFLSDKYNDAKVHTTTPKADQFIFMDAQFNAAYDVDVLASAFNMDKADFMGRLKLIDDFTTFDNERFDVIRENSTQIEEVTAAELALMQNVKAVLVDREWFQVYDNLINMTEVFVSSGLYWNYNLNVWRTVSSSPFSNAIVFVDSTAAPTQPVSATFTISALDNGPMGTIVTLSPSDSAKLGFGDYEFIQGGLLVGTDSYEYEYQLAVKSGVAIHKYGVIIIPDGVDSLEDEAGTGGLFVQIGNVVYENHDVTDVSALAVGDTLTFTPLVDPGD